MTNHLRKALEEINSKIQDVDNFNSEQQLFRTLMSIEQIAQKSLSQPDPPAKEFVDLTDDEIRDACRQAISNEADRPGLHSACVVTDVSRNRTLGPAIARAAISAQKKKWGIE